MKLLEKLLVTPAPAQPARQSIAIGDTVRCRRWVGRVVRLEAPVRGSKNSLVWVEFEAGGGVYPWYVRDVERVV